jgi:5'-methylthioadenosine phosphorylase
MKKLGVEVILSLSACGSLKEELRPMDFVIPDQFVDRTNQARKMTFFGNGIVAHIALAHPICEELGKMVFEIGKKGGLNIHYGGTYVNMEGPAFSTKAESELYRSWGMDIIGMTNMCEAKLAREAEICYVSVCAVTDYDCWHSEHDSVTIDMIIGNLTKNIENFKKLIKAAVPRICQHKRDCKCKDALATAIITDRKLIPEKVKRDLAPILSKYLK